MSARGLPRDNLFEMFDLFDDNEQFLKAQHAVEADLRKVYQQDPNFAELLDIIKSFLPEEGQGLG